MNERDAKDLIAEAVPRGGGTWADLGAGRGTFTRALVELLGTEVRVLAVDRDPDAIAALERWAAKIRANVVAIRGDFTGPIERLGLGDTRLDGMLFANALHFVPDAEDVLRRLTARLRPGGRVVIVEYDQRPASRWVPYPLPAERWFALAQRAGLSAPVITATRRSEYGGQLYAAAADRPAAGERSLGASSS